MIDFNTLWPKYGIKPNSVLHLGANEGQEAEVYHKFGVSHVVWVEAIPEVFEKLTKNVEKYGHSCMLLCVGDDEGKEVVFNVSNNEAQSSSYLELGHHKIIHPTVSYQRHFPTVIRRIDSVFHPDSFKEGDWFLNADLQGAELQAFKGMGDMIKDFKWIYTEVNKKETYEGCAMIEEVDEYLAQFGFVRIETGPWVADTWTDALYVKGDMKTFAGHNFTQPTIRRGL